MSLYNKLWSVLIFLNLFKCIYSEDRHDTIEIPIHKNSCIEFNNNTPDQFVVVVHPNPTQRTIRNAIHVWHTERNTGTQKS